MGGLGSGRQPDEARRREVIRLRAEGLTLVEIGRRLGISRQRVDQILRAIDKERTRRLACLACGGAVAPPGGAPPDVADILCLSCLAESPETPFAQRLRSCRAAAGLRLRDLARRVGLSTETLRCYESGVREPRWQQLAPLLRVLGPALVAQVPYEERDEPPGYPPQATAERRGA
ncbi:MAG TPA: helix-turn-helix domain-containing protein [Gemmataceae bacterium]|nr:helix-turn-helix domain-containing protein [Gemmataceae bacterium]